LKIDNEKLALKLKRSTADLDEAQVSLTEQIQENVKLKQGCITIQAKCEALKSKLGFAKTSLQEADEERVELLIVNKNMRQSGAFEFDLPMSNNNSKRKPRPSVANADSLRRYSLYEENIDQVEQNRRDYNDLFNKYPFYNKEPLNIDLWVFKNMKRSHLEKAGFSKS